MMAVLLENIPTTVTVARATISSVYRTAHLVASIPNLSYQKKVTLYVFTWIVPNILVKNVCVLVLGMLLLQYITGFSRSTISPASISNGTP